MDFPPILAQASSIRLYIQLLKNIENAKKELPENIAELPVILKNHRIRHVLAHDYYLKVRCGNEKFFVRGRMKDAVKYLAELQGIQIHRSHWVTENNIQRAFLCGRDLKLLL